MYLISIMIFIFMEWHLPKHIQDLSTFPSVGRGPRSCTLLLFFNHSLPYSLWSWFGDARPICTEKPVYTKDYTHHSAGGCSKLSGLISRVRKAEMQVCLKARLSDLEDVCPNARPVEVGCGDSVVRKGRWLVPFQGISAHFIGISPSIYKAHWKGHSASAGKKMHPNG